IVGFAVHCSLAGDDVLSFETAFGFFDSDSLARQSGLPAASLTQELPASDVHIDLRQRPPALFAGALRLPGPQLLMLDAITGYWPTGGAAGLGAICARQDIHPRAWYFKAHFYQDPVQPGSLGLEALLQLLAAYLLMSDAGRDFARPRFQPLATGESFDWRYRGQVLPTNREVTTELEIVRINRTPGNVTAIAHGSLFVDDLRIYAANGLGVRIVEDRVPADRVDDDATGVPPLKVQLPTRDALARYWRGELAGVNPVFEDLSFALMRKFVGDIVLEDASILDRLRETPVLFVANHQNVIESALFMAVLPAIIGRTINALAIERHQSLTWLGQLMAHLYNFPGVRDPTLMHHFVWEDKNALLDELPAIRATLTDRRRSILVHAGGARATSCRQPLSAISAVLIDLAVENGIPLVPVRFVGGLPVEPVDRQAFPTGDGFQDIYIGRPVAPDALAKLKLPAAKQLVLDRVNNLGVRPEHERPNPPDLDFTRRVDALARALGCFRASAVVLHLLGALEDASTASTALGADAAALEALREHARREYEWVAALRAMLLREDHVAA
ncbi:MAG: 1-acyl-sn-glycerol-3-phosphate acyltransferase, partial [Gammaproteobacteria bacterium]